MSSVKNIIRWFYAKYFYELGDNFGIKYTHMRLNKCWYNREKRRLSITNCEEVGEAYLRNIMRLLLTSKVRNFKEVQEYCLVLFKEYRKRFGDDDKNTEAFINNIHRHGNRLWLDTLSEEGASDTEAFFMDIDDDTKGNFNTDFDKRIPF